MFIKHELKGNIYTSLKPSSDIQICSCYFILIYIHPFPFCVSFALPAVHISGPKFVSRGHPIHLTCNATGIFRAPEEIDWFQKGKIIQSSGLEEIQITKYIIRGTKTLQSELLIKHSDTSDTGSYVCRSSEDKLISHDVLVLNGELLIH